MTFSEARVHRRISVDENTCDLYAGATLELVC